MAKISNEEMVAMSILEKIVQNWIAILEIVMEFTELEVVKEKLHEDD